MAKPLSKRPMFLGLLLLSMAALAGPLMAQRGFRGDSSRGTSESRVVRDRGHRPNTGGQHRGHEHVTYKVVYETIPGYYKTEFQNVWVPGHFDIVKERVFVPGYYEDRVRYVRHGDHHHKVVDKVFIEGRYEIKERKVWHAGEYVCKEVKVWVPPRQVARQVPVVHRH
ncbi:MAG: hypothetical protein KDB07_10295 [Planctomycetes bacterium]|nr:hypothetical protein [Planctomycetota bacterium]